AATVTFTLSLHDALPIFLVHELSEVREHIDGHAPGWRGRCNGLPVFGVAHRSTDMAPRPERVFEVFRKPLRIDVRIPNQQRSARSEEHTSELQSRENHVC